MKIYGYSERGAMNALFYEMALKEKKVAEKDMNAFLELAGFKGYSDFEIYLEFSLSEFGSPDLAIIARKPSKTVFFVEAKVSACQGYHISSALNEFCNKENPDTSNLFFQLNLKKTFFELKDEIPNKETEAVTMHTSMGDRSIGNNPVVRNLVEEIRQCDKAEYIAIVPEDSYEDEGWKERIGINDLRMISWKEIYDKFSEKYVILKATMLFNQGKDPKTKSKKIRSQILNNPIPLPINL